MVKDVSAPRALPVMLALVLSTATAGAQGVSQDLGIRDSEYATLNMGICKDCHGETLVDRHHETSRALSGECVFCHPVSDTPGSMGVSLRRDCMQCHLDTPHHETEAALNNQCTECHDTPGLSDYSTQEAGYPISKVTPTVEGCKNCHVSGEWDGIQIVNFEETHHGTGIENCDTCHEADSETTNIRICARCHSKDAIHEVASHIDVESCSKCHNI